jgi:hypothetical protein
VVTPGGTATSGAVFTALTLPTLSVNDVTVTEGNSGSVNAVFTVTLSAASAQTVTVAYATANGTATAGSDYSVRSGTLSFSPGTTTQAISVPVTGDTVVEPDETFFVILSNPAGATIANPQGQGTILNNDLPRITINDVSIIEGSPGAATNVTFTVSLSAEYSGVVSVNYATANGTATSASGDYVATSGTVTFQTGTTSQTVTVVVNGDARDENDETVNVNLSGAVNATIADSRGVGRILDDDDPPTMTVSDPTLTEGNSGTKNMSFTVSLSAASGKTVTVSYATADGSATAGSDYQAKVPTTLTFSAGQTSKTVTVKINGDTTLEPDEVFYLNLTSPVNVSLLESQGIATIRNDDQ